MMTLYALLNPKRQEQIRNALGQPVVGAYRERPRLRRLTQHQREDIRTRYRPGERGAIAAFAKEFGVSREHIWRVARGTG